MIWNMRKICLSLATATGIGAVTAACFLPGSIAPTHAAGNTQKPDAAKELFLEKCSGCHQDPDPDALEYTPQKWRATVNRMLNQHNARTSISDDEAAQIVTYLSQFAPKPLGPNDPARNVTASAWSMEPTISRNYTFSDSDQLASFEKARGTWTFVPTTDVSEGFVKSSATANGLPALLIESKTQVTGDLDVRAQFRIRKGTSGSVGLIADYQDPKNYLVARYDSGDNSVALVRLQQGQPTVIAQTTLTAPLGETPDGWHDLRVKSFGGGHSVEVWLDYVRQEKAADPGWQPNGRVGLDLSGETVAGFRQLSLDVYPSATQ
jgi:mono/diheme cytochrome c family protein